MNIKTLYKTNASGTGQILAKGGGKQRTLPYDHNLSPRENHFNAALVVLGIVTPGAAIAPRVEVVEIDNGRASFTFG